MQVEEIWKKLSVINTWKRGTQRAPHKPLLLLYALGWYSRNGTRLIPYERIDHDLRELLINFGPSRKSYHPEYPFWRLRNDGIWELENLSQLATRPRNQDLRKSELIRHDVSGGLSQNLYQALQEEPTMIRELAQRILDEYFTPGVHADILAAVGLDLSESTYQYVRRRQRDPRFRNQVLAAYDFRCALCGFDLKMGRQSLALEAAHIQWHCYQGPDVVPNGISLCSIHHELFDKGAWTLDAEKKIRVSNRVGGKVGLQECLLRFVGHSLELPNNIASEPRPQYVRWHQREVYRGGELG
jgi:putative restriction endonuclease